MKANAKTERILDIALALLKSEGDYGVTMRQVASRAGMSLSNVQYYFKNKNELLKAVADRYFKQCLEELKSVQALRDHQGLHDELSPMLRAFLDHGSEISDMCRVFREYWAISSRNETIESYIMDYYDEMARILMAILEPVADSRKCAAEAVSIIIPYIEGYSITAAAMPENVDRVTELLTSIVVRLLKQGNQS